jgi:hypothetical protein
VLLRTEGGVVRDHSPGVRRYDRRTERASGASLVETVIAVVVGSTVLIACMAMATCARRVEHRTGITADALAEAALAHTWLSRDLARLVIRTGQPAIRVEPVPATEGSRAARAVGFDVADDPGAPASSVRWVFTPATWELVRHVPGRPDQVFRLGRGSVVAFVLLDPSFADGGPPVRGRFNNRFVYRLTGGSGAADDRPGATLVGGVPLVLKASHDTFPFWNRRDPRAAGEVPS